MTLKTTPADLHVKGRDLRFDLEGARQRHWLGGDPVATAVFNALSLTFPEGERMFIDAVKAHRGSVSGKLAEDVNGFIAQEAIHSREHHLLNMLIDRVAYPVEEIEGWIREQVAFGRSQGPMAMLVATIALEHFTAMMAESHIRNADLFADVDPGIERLWRWHAMEETEHKAVAFDVFMAATRGMAPARRYWRRCVSMAIITLNFTDNITRFAARLLEADGYSPSAARKAVRRFVWVSPGLFTRGWRTYFAWYRPGFHPFDHNPEAAVFAAWKADFDTAAPAAA